MTGRVQPILRYPDTRLLKPSKRVDDYGAALVQLIDDLAATMLASDGIGLAAPQIGVYQRVVVCDLRTDPEAPPEPAAFVNPVILARRGTITWEEGCLSIPGFTGEVTRAEEVDILYENSNQIARHGTLQGLQAVCLQHEIDHLDGELFIGKAKNIQAPKRYFRP